jgi:hypothetical protein
MEYDQIEQQLLNEIRAARGHEVFTANSLLDLLYVIEQGARRMVAEGQTSARDVARAKKNLSRFLAEMDAERARLGYAEFREETGGRARSTLCPGLWPFC